MPRPSVFPEWTDGDSSKVTEPSSGKKALGWTASERPAFQFMNWLFYQINLWLEYLDGAIGGAILAYPLIFNAIVGTEDGCTHASLADALADSAVVAGSRIFVVSPEALATTVQVLKNNIEIIFHPLAVFSAGGAATAIQISADGVKVHDGRFTGFGTAGILIDSGSDYSMVYNNRFASCTSAITDNNGTGTAYGNIEE